MIYNVANGEAIAISNKDKFPHLPDELVRHIELLRAQGKTCHRLLDALDRSPEQTAKAIDDMFKLASKATRLRPAKLLRKTDFKAEDLASNRLDAAFAEIRAINFLHEQDFTQIKLLKANFSEKLADLTAKRKQNKYVIEVILSAFDADNRFSPKQLSRWLVSRYHRKKREQLNNTKAKYKADRKVVVGVVNTKATVVWQTHKVFLESAKKSWKSCGDQNLYICLLTGRVALGCGKDDAVYPPWS